MKKTILAFAIVFMAITSFAQDKKGNPYHTLNGYHGFLEIGGARSFNDIFAHCYTISTTHGYQFNDRIFTGLGVGCEMSLNHHILIPFYASFRYIFNDNRISPVIRIRAGAFYHKKDLGPYGNIAVGVRIATKKDLAFNLLAGATYYGDITVMQSDYKWLAGNSHDNQENPSNLSLTFSMEW